ncbi:MAG: DUF167 domain-containing protein [Acidimicrobiales bacterium]
MTADPLRIRVRVKPGARHEGVGGRWGEEDVLVVAVRAPATEGKANAAVVAAVAEALGVRARTVRIVAGAGGRNKVLEIIEPPVHVRAAIADLLAV